MRLLFFNEADTAKNFQLRFKFGSLPHHNIVEQNEIYNGHRGGITLGGSYNEYSIMLLEIMGNGAIAS